MKHSEALAQFTQILTEGGMEEQEAQTEVRHALSKLENCDISALLLKAQLPLSESVEYRMREVLKRRLTGEPLAYILKERWFMGLPFYVTPAVLIPRQETEMLAETAVQLIRQEGFGKVLDLCTGSGCIAVSIARYTRARVSASDISGEALKVAKTNAEKNLVKVDFFASDLFDTVIGKYDIIVSNPPYISKTELETLQTEVRDHEPRLALVAAENGLAFYRKIIAESHEHLTERGVLLMEIGNEQGAAVKDMCLKAGYRNVQVRKDYSGWDRMVIAQDYQPPQKEKTGKTNA